MKGSTVLSLVSSTPVITAGAYSALDQVGGVNTLTNAAGAPGGTAKLTSLTIVDKGQGKAVLEVWLFRSAPTMVGADNDAFDITDAQLGKAIGHIAVAATDYKDAASSGSLACVKNVGLVCDSADGHLYYVLKCTGTPTYVAVSDLTLKFGFEAAAP